MWANCDVENTVGNRSLVSSQVMRPVVILFAALCAVSASAQQASPSIDPPAGAQLILEARGSGAQIYACTQTAGSFKWTLKGPDAKLLDKSGKQIGTHLAGPTWKLSDGSQVQGEPAANRPSPDAGSVPWLLLRAKPGTASGTLANVAYVQRTETQGGAAPATGCSAPADLDKTVRISYSATYRFYSAPAR
jgi:hypothetical protein